MSKERFNHRKKRRNKHGFMDRMVLRMEEKFLREEELKEDIN
jgi:hypothetical protein